METRGYIDRYVQRIGRESQKVVSVVRRRVVLHIGRDRVHRSAARGRRLERKAGEGCEVEPGAALFGALQEFARQPEPEVQKTSLKRLCGARVRTGYE